MKKINKLNPDSPRTYGFTLIELLVVITIIALVTSGWMFYFTDFINNQQIQQKTNILKKQISSYDQQIKNKQIYDYQFLFELPKNSLWYTVDKNMFDLAAIQLVDYDFVSQEADIQRTGSGMMTIYKKNKLFHRSEISGQKYVTLKYQDRYTISWSQSGSILNEVDIVYYSPDNNDSIPENNISLVAINTQRDEWWTSISQLFFQNINGQKQLLADWVPILQAALIFEYAGKHAHILLTP